MTTLIAKRIKPWSKYLKQLNKGGPNVLIAKKRSLKKSLAEL